MTTHHLEDILSATSDFGTCPACGLFTTDDIRRCKRCKAKCCTSCQSVDGDDCMACGLDPEWQAAVNYPKRDR